jgi:hypothetical protein
MPYHASRPIADGVSPGHPAPITAEGNTTLKPHDRSVFVPSSVLAATLAAGAVGCAPEGKTSPPDREAPVSEAFIATSGAETPLGPSGMLLGARQARVRLTMNEPGSIYYTTDGSEPTPGDPDTGQAGQTISTTLVRDTELRWFAVDLAGNREAERHRTFIRFDSTPPDVTIDPQPDPGIPFPGPVTVRVTADEPVTIYYTTDGRIAVPGGSTTRTAQDVLELTLEHPTTLSVRVTDLANNLWGPKNFTYVVDDVAPTTAADPPGGAFLAPIEVRLGINDPSGTIHYTLDGSEPDASAPVWSGVEVFSVETTLKFRGVDPGGNWEPTRTETYRIGPIGPRAPVAALDAERVDVAGSLALAAALMNAAGRWSGRSDGPTYTADAYEMWAIGRTASDAVLLMSHAGFSPVYAPLNIARAGSAQASPDRDGNGSNLEETLAATLGGLAAFSEDSVPANIYPLVLPFEGASALLLREPDPEVRADGLPVAEDDYAGWTWEGSAGPLRNHTAAGLHATMAALAARIGSATSVSHVTGDGTFARDVAPVLGQRCLGCHRPGADRPDLTAPTAVEALVVRGAPAASPLMQYLGRDVPHPSVPATSAQRTAVADWIESDATVPVGGTMRPGLTAREGTLALIAWQQSGYLYDWVGRSFGLDPGTGRLNVLGTNGVRYVPAEIRATDRQGLPGLPRRPESFGIVDARYGLGEQARGLVAALALVRIGESRSGGWASAPLQSEGAIAGATEYARNAAALLPERAFEPVTATYRSSWSPEAGFSPELATADAGDALVGLAVGSAAGLVDRGVASARVAALREALDANVRPDFWYPDALSTDPAVPVTVVRPGLEAQLAVLGGLLALSEGGDEDALSSARRLWGRLGAFWDAEAGTFQTALGDPLYTYTPALAARVVEVLDAAARAGLVEAETRLSTFFRSTVRAGLVASELWWTGEIASGPDDDLDGIPKPGDVPVGRGVAPTFRREIRFEE